jgi:exportin-1
VCLEVINNFATATDPAVTNAFFQQYFLSILQDIFFVLTDADHKSGFKLQSALLARLYQLVDTNVIAQPLYDPAAFPETLNNTQFLRDYTANLLKSAFPHVSKSVGSELPLLSELIFFFFLNLRIFNSAQIQIFVAALVEHNNDINRFKLALRDFLIQLKEFSAGDNAELYLEEKELESQQKAEAERQAAMRIPGMLKPSQLDDKDEDI